MLKPGGVLGFVEPYVQNAQQEADFGAPQSALGINENVHTRRSLASRRSRDAGLALEVFSLSDSFNAIYRRSQSVGPRASGNQGSAREFSVIASDISNPVLSMPGALDGSRRWGARLAGAGVSRELSYHLSV